MTPSLLAASVAIHEAAPLWYLAPVGAVLALVMALVFYKGLMANSEGDSEMIRISEAVRQGAYAYLGRQRNVVALVFVALIIVLIFLYFYAPFESYVSESIGEIRARNVIFWFAALVGALGYAIAHFASFRRTILRRSDPPPPITSM